MAKYSDLNKSFRQSLSDNQIVVNDLTVIKKNLERLFQTGKGDVPFNREFGTSLKRLLFETNLDPSDIVNYLYMDITTFEPRIELNPNDIIIEQLDNNAYLVTCNFIVPTLNNTSSSLQTVINKQ